MGGAGGAGFPRDNVFDGGVHRGQVILQEKSTVVILVSHIIIGSGHFGIGAKVQISRIWNCGDLWNWIIGAYRVLG